MSTGIIKEALDYYDKQNEKYENIKKKIKYIKILDPKLIGLAGLNLAFYDKDKNELFRSRVEVLSKYINKIKTWIWGWGIAEYDKSYSSIIRKVFLYGTDIWIKSGDIDSIILKNELVTSRFKITDDVQIDIFCAIASYLSKKEFILEFTEFLPDADNDNNDYILYKGKKWSNKSNLTLYMFIVNPPKIK